MNTSHTHRNPIGFKVTDNKLMVFEENKPELEITPLTPNDEAILKMIVYFHQLMQKRATMFYNDRPFFDIEGEKIVPMLNKVYTKYYEKF